MKVGDSVTYYLRNDGHEMLAGKTGNSFIAATIAFVNVDGTATLRVGKIYVIDVSPGTNPGQFLDSST
jgi:hypothetical protein